MLTTRQRWAVAIIAAEIFVDLLALTIVALPLGTQPKTYGLVVTFGVTVLWNVMVFIHLMRVTPGNPAVIPPVVGPSIGSIKAGLFAVVVDTLLDVVALALLLISMGLLSTTILVWVTVIVVVTLIWDGVMAYFVLR